MLKYFLVLSGALFVAVACTKKDNPAPAAPTEEQVFRGKFTNIWWNLDSVQESGATIKSIQEAMMFCSGDSFLTKDLTNNKIVNTGQKWHYKSPTHIVVDGQYSNSHATDTYIKGLTSHYYEMDLDTGGGVFAQGYLSR